MHMFQLHLQNFNLNVIYFCSNVVFVCLVLLDKSTCLPLNLNLKLFTQKLKLSHYLFAPMLIER